MLTEQEIVDFCGKLIREGKHSIGQGYGIGIARGALVNAIRAKADAPEPAEQVVPMDKLRLYSDGILRVCAANDTRKIDILTDDRDFRTESLPRFLDSLVDDIKTLRDAMGKLL